jgi:hypothetical protein
VQYEILPPTAQQLKIGSTNHLAARDRICILIVLIVLIFLVSVYDNAFPANAGPAGPATPPRPQVSITDHFRQTFDFSIFILQSSLVMSGRFQFVQ